jgi:hypothetical protein
MQALQIITRSLGRKGKLIASRQQKSASFFGLLVNKRQAHTDSHAHKAVATKDFHPDTKLSTNQTPDESVLFSNKLALEKFKKLRASGKLKEEFMELTEQEYNHLERTLEERAKNEVIMEFDVDEATYHKLMRKLRPDNYKEYVVPWVERLALGYGPNTAKLYRVRGFLVSMFPDAREAIIDEAIAKDAAWAKEKGYNAKSLPSEWVEERKRIIEKANKNKIDLKKLESDDDDSEALSMWKKDMRDHGVPQSFGELWSRTYKVLSRYADSQLMKKHKNFRLQPETISSHVHDDVNALPGAESASGRVRFSSDADLLDLLENGANDPIKIFSNKAGLEVARSLVHEFHPAQLDGKVKIYTGESLNPPNQWRAPDEDDLAALPASSKIAVDRITSEPILDPMIPQSASEYVVSLKLERFFDHFYPIEDPVERMAFAEQFDISPGERTLEFLQSFPPVEHTYEEIPIIKEVEEEEEHH